LSSEIESELERIESLGVPEQIAALEEIIKALEIELR